MIGRGRQMGKTVEITFEIDAELYEKVKEMYAPQGITPEQLIVDFINFCAAPETRQQAKELLAKWKKQDDAVKLYKTGTVSIGYCSEMAGMHKTDFIRLLGLNHISIFDYENEEEFKKDIDNA